MTGDLEKVEHFFQNGHHRVKVCLETRGRFRRCCQAQPRGCLGDGMKVEGRVRGTCRVRKEMGTRCGAVLPSVPKKPTPNALGRAQQASPAPTPALSEALAPDGWLSQLGRCDLWNNGQDAGDMWLGATERNQI